MVATITNNTTTQMITAAMNVKRGQNTQKVDIERYNISVKEHNKSFLYSPQVRPTGFTDLGKPHPNTGPNTALSDPNGPRAEGRGGKLDISV